MNFTLIGFILYLILVLIVGFITYAKNKSHNDYFLADRKLPAFVVAFSERASGESAWLLLALPGAVYAAGLFEVWAALGCVIGIIFYWIFIAKRLRIETEKFGAITLPNFIAEKFGEGNNNIRITGLVIIFFFFTFYLAAQFSGAGKVLFITFGIPHIYGIIIGTSVIILYTLLGGFLAVAWTDMIQGIIMLGTLVILPIAGLVEIASQGTTLSESLQPAGDSFLSLTKNETGFSAVALIISGLSWAFGYMGQPHLLTRFMSIKKADSLKQSRKIAFVWAIPAFAGAIGIGVVGMSLYGDNHFSDLACQTAALDKKSLPAWLS